MNIDLDSRKANGENSGTLPSEDTSILIYTDAEAGCGSAFFTNSFLRTVLLSVEMKADSIMK